MSIARRLAWIGAFAALTAACQSVWEFPHREDYATLRAIKIGATEAEIRSALGEPAFVHPKGTRPGVYCLSGRTCRTDRIVTGRLLVYIRGKPSAYYFLDASGRVEYVYVGGA
jgi:hypothetical protein